MMIQCFQAMDPNGSWPPPVVPNDTSWPSSTRPPIKYAGLLLILIPMVTILGNLLVIISVLRYRALQTAINFLILGLAVADLLVALFVMPYAVYVHEIALFILGWLWSCVYKPRNCPGFD
ncbi:hypothetical protein ANCCAN_19026 [Ancylostoma caninum]|uniref:G-protein coupled receptors family 1 profile domain-containing protein n=1 Tax=Ancylostoma caninum TaxID=29170 RepID=A0A368FVX1_ANCCA|nr:hypothetical protein ANCCAN_19026 [Ancylostoma caninum]